MSRKRIFNEQKKREQFTNNFFAQNTVKMVIHRN